MTRLVWLADVLRKAGLAVVEEPGWKDRGREMGNIEGVLLHHTAGPLKGNFPSEKVIKDGRPGLRGPLANLGLTNDGVYYVFSAGKANHAGKGSWRNLKNNGNSHLIGIEAENTGLSNDPWTPEEYNSYVKGVVALLDYLKLPTDRVIGHKEWAPRRKIDPSFDMNKFREDVDMARRKKPEVEKSVPLEEKVMADPGTPRYAKQRLMRMGWTEQQAAAIVAQAMVESEFTPDIKVYTVNKVEVPNETPNAKLTSYGIMKWSDGRMDNLFRIEGEKPSLDKQINFIDWELRNTEKVSGKELKDSDNMMDALRAAVGYVRPKNWTKEFPENCDGWKERVTFAFNLID